MLRVVLALCLLLALQSVRAETPVDCESKTNGGGYYEVRCPLSSVDPAAWRFRATFTGVHDDSAT
jgi:hypothetical protein